MTAAWQPRGRPEAERYFETLYGAEPPGLIGLVSFKPGRCECMSTSSDAALAVTGQLDVYTRIGLLREAPPKGERGDSSYTSAIPGVWAEFDVNGSPNGRSGAVQDAFTSIEHAVEFAGRVLEPTMLVHSGFGVHAYWLLEQPWRLEDDEQREQAKTLVQHWQATLRERARERGVHKLDSTHDLARVFRPPGSLNAKGDGPTPVELIHADGSRYKVEQIRVASADPKAKAKPKAEAPKGTSTVGVEELIERFPMLGDLARRKAPKGKRPKDDSPSGWDMHLAIRAAGLGASDGEVSELLRYSRELDGEDEKGDREDYIVRTVAKARDRVGVPLHKGTIADHLRWLTKMSLAQRVDMQVTGATIAGKGSTARAVLHLTGPEGEYDIPFARFDQVATAKRLSTELSLTLGIKVVVSEEQALEFGARMRAIAERGEEIDEGELVLDATDDLLEAARVFTFTPDQAGRWGMFGHVHDHSPGEVDLGDGRKSAVRMADAYARDVRIARDTDGNRWVRTDWVQTYLRLRNNNWAGAYVHQVLTADGWEYRGKSGKVKATDPMSKRALIVRFYIVPKGWGR